MAEPLTPEHRARIEAAVKVHQNPHEGAQPDIFAYALADAVPDLLAEIERLRELAQGRLEHFQHSEQSRALHFQRTEQLRSALEHIQAITAPEMVPLYSVRPHECAGVSAHKIAKCALEALG